MQFRFIPSGNKDGSADSIEGLLERCGKFVTRNQRVIIKKAYLLSEDAHKFQKRLSGEPYIIHPLAVANTLAEMEQDFEVICAALLHDVLEDTTISSEYMKQEFGENITYLVEGVTKISQLKTQSLESKQAINIRKMIMATIRDKRVILIKLADKLHNMRTLGFHSTNKGMSIARETLDIYAPLAGRLGIYRIKSELEDLSLYHLDRNVYQEIKEKVSEKKTVRDERVQIAIAVLKQDLKENKIKAIVEGRSKHFYSIYKKMQEQKKSFEEIYDLTGLRVLVENVQECFSVMGIAHTVWTPVPGRFKDYISVPKSNGYQSLHTTVVGPGGKFLELQIRTHRMHQISEYGIASHWAYKEGFSDNKIFEDQLASLQNIAIDEESEDSGEFLDELVSNLSNEDEVFVITPRGKIITMPQHSTVLDFAFRIHTDIGLRCAGAKIGDRLISIRAQLKSGDQVEIITNPSVKPSLNWLNFLVTPHARAKLRAWFRKNEYLPSEKPPEKKEPEKSEQADKPRGPERQIKPKISPSSLLPRRIEWAGETEIDFHFARCCSPEPPDPIQGFITRGHGISVHKKGCPSLVSMSKQVTTADRVIPLKWVGADESFTAKILVSGIDRSQIYLDLVTMLTQSGANILEAEAHTAPNGKISDMFRIEVDSEDHLSHVKDALRSVNGVENVERKE